MKSNKNPLLGEGVCPIPPPNSDIHVAYRDRTTDLKSTITNYFDTY